MIIRGPQGAVQGAEQKDRIYCLKCKSLVAYLQRTKSRNACSWCFAIGLTAGVPQTYKGRNCCISHSQIAVIKGCQKADLTMNPEQVKINNTPQRTPLLGRKIKITRSGISWQNETAKGSKITTG